MGIRTDDSGVGKTNSSQWGFSSYNRLSAETLWIGWTIDKDWDTGEEAAGAGAGK